MDKVFDIYVASERIEENYVINAENVENAVAGAIRDFRMFYKEDPILIQLSERDTDSSKAVPNIVKRDGYKLSLS